MKQPSCLTTKRQSRTKRVQIALFFILLIQMVICSNLTQAHLTQYSSTQSRLYWLHVKTTHDELVTSYYGFQQLTLNRTSSSSFHGLVTWNLTWDDGNSWFQNNATYTYATNRTYEYAGLSCYTGWWINPAVVIGEKIRIDGDSPATNYFLRTAPFIVTDLISCEIQGQFYLCWQLTYLTQTGQQEAYYYEYHTGTLVKATSISHEMDHHLIEVVVELRAATPPIPTEHILFHFWINYNSLIFALLGATLVTLCIHNLLHRFLLRTTKSGSNASPET